jgi:hypothetical protein
MAPQGLFPHLFRWPRRVFSHINFDGPAGSFPASISMAPRGLFLHLFRWPRRVFSHINFDGPAGSFPSINFDGPAGSFPAINFDGTAGSFRLGITRAPACRIPDVGRPRSASLSSLPGTPPCRIRVTLLIARALPCRMPVVARPRSTLPGLLGPADFPGSPPCPFIAGVPFVPDTGRLVPSPFSLPPALDGRSLDGDWPLGPIITP